MFAYFESVNCVVIYSLYDVFFLLYPSAAPLRRFGDPIIGSLFLCAEFFPLYFPGIAHAVDSPRHRVPPGYGGRGEKSELGAMSQF